MRKWLLLLVFLCGIVLCSCCLADSYVLDEIYAAVDIPDEYVVLTPKNLSDFAVWMESKGLDTESVTNDFLRRGVLLQAWNEDEGRVFEIRAEQTDETQIVFDVNVQTTEYRSQYRLSHYPNNEYEGYDFSSSEWKNTGDAGRFLMLKYVRRESGEILYRGYMRKTIRNGYEITLDMQVSDRSLTSKDNSALNTIWNSFRFVEVLDLPPAAKAQINITGAPPTETHSQSFNITGTAAEGVKFTAVVMGLNYPDPVVSEMTVGKNGKVSIPIKIPREGVFLITVTAEYKDEEVLELAYPVTYQRTMLAVNFTTSPGETTAVDEIKFAGTSEAGASIQVFVDGELALTKKVTSAGKFAVTTDLKEEGTHEVALVFSKKGLADRRFTFTVTRRWSDADTLASLKKQAVKPSYKQLTSKPEKYEGRILGYTAYITDVSQSGMDWVITMAMSRKNGKYSNYFLVIATEEPSFKAGDKVEVYGTFEGMSLSVGEDGSEEINYPCMNLLLFVTTE